ITPVEVVTLIEYITSSRKGRRSTHLELIITLFNRRFSEYTIGLTLRRHCFKRALIIKKPPISNRN
ncbi:hypothetical protein ACRALDRAFT_2108004, partial [Sodiomyces alcalophilus JCM 7366]|uniref:uncharacterized protein n=1 Tax=Sodiomyces alcalophilus JCM 7366 TaxID=591952 RepID=UPI0039B42F50